MGRCVKIQKDTLLFTYAAVKCCSYKYQKNRKRAWETGAGLAKKKSQPNSPSFTILKQGQIKLTNQYTNKSNYYYEIMCDRSPSWPAMLKWLQSMSLASLVNTWCPRWGISVLRTQGLSSGGFGWCSGKTGEIPGEIHLEGPNSKPGIWLICRTNACFSLGNRCSPEYTRNTMLCFQK